MARPLRDDAPTAQMLRPAAEQVPGATEALVLTMRCGRLAELHAQRALRAYGLDGSQVAVLYALGCTPDGALSGTQLRALLAQTPSGLTRTVARLEAAGLVQRSADPSDGRGTLVALSTGGRERIEGAMAAMVEAFEELLSAAGVDDLSAAVPVLFELAEVLGGVPLDARQLGATRAPSH